MKKTIIITIGIVLVVLLSYTQILKKIYPKKYNEYVEKYSQKYELDSLLIYSIIKAESNFKEDAKSNSGAIGLMQIMISTAQEMEKINEQELYIPQNNIKIGVQYFKSLLEKYDNYNLAIIAYNAGMGNLDNWIEQGIIDEQGEQIENIPFQETKNYVKKILKNYKIYKEIYG